MSRIRNFTPYADVLSTTGSLPRDAVTYTELFMLSYTFLRWLTSNTDGRLGYFIKQKDW